MEQNFQQFQLAQVNETMQPTDCSNGVYLVLIPQIINQVNNEISYPIDTDFENPNFHTDYQVMNVVPTDENSPHPQTYQGNNEISNSNKTDMENPDFLIDNQLMNTTCTDENSPQNNLDNTSAYCVDLMNSCEKNLEGSHTSPIGNDSYGQILSINVRGTGSQHTQLFSKPHEQTIGSFNKENVQPSKFNESWNIHLNKDKICYPSYAENMLYTCTRQNFGNVQNSAFSNRQCYLPTIQIPNYSEQILTNEREDNPNSEACCNVFMPQAHLKPEPSTNCEDKNFISDFRNKCLPLEDSSNRLTSAYTCNKIQVWKHCDKDFLQKYNLNFHMVVPKVKKPEICKISNKGFSLKGNINKHLTLHTKEKPYICEICIKGFSTRFNLKQHMTLHTKKRTLYCEICNKGFLSKGHPNQHIMIHTKEKPNICEICNKGFSQKIDPSKHLRVHTKEKTYICEIYKNVFSFKKKILKGMSVLRSEKRV